jgi:hypothetical protein
MKLRLSAHRISLQLRKTDNSFAVSATEHHPFCWAVRATENNLKRLVVRRLSCLFFQQGGG